MPILNTQKTKNYTYAIWFIEEELDELLKALNTTASEYTEVHNISHINRRKQNIAARLLLNHLAMKKVKLKYAQNGAPYCTEFKHISISHSKNYCALITSNNNIGIDVQYQKDPRGNLGSTSAPEKIGHTQLRKSIWYRP